MCKASDNAVYIQKLFIELNNQFNLDYTFKFHNKKRSLGTCDWGEKIIYVSKFFLETTPLDILENTLRHEFAHALDARERGFSNHDKNWKKWCLVIGCRPERCTPLSKEQMPKAKYKWVCENHGVIGTAHRKTTKKYNCSKCKTSVNLELA